MIPIIAKMKESILYILRFKDIDFYLRSLNLIKRKVLESSSFKLTIEGALSNSSLVNGSVIEGLDVSVVSVSTELFLLF